MIKLKTGGSRSKSDSPEKPARRKCSHSVESWPEHLMTMIAGRWVSKTHATEFNTEFIRKKKKRSKTLIACMVIAVCAGGFFYWQHNQATLVGTAEGISGDTQSALKSIVGSITGNDDATSSSESELQKQYTATAQRILNSFEVDTKATTPPNLGATWASLPPDAWPAMTLHNNVRSKRGGIFVGGSTFIAQRTDDSVIAFADANVLNPERKQETYERVLSDFANNLDSWEVSLRSDKKKRIRFDSVFGDPDKLLDQITRFNGRLLLSRSEPPSSLPTVPLRVDLAIPAVGEAVFLVGFRPGSANAKQVVQVGALLDVNTSTHTLTIGYEIDENGPDFTSSPVLNSSGRLIGIVAKPTTMKSEDMPAGMGLLSTTATFHFAAEVNGD